MFNVMFQSLLQGSLISILYKNEPRVVDGKVLSVNTHMPTYNPNQPMAMLGGMVTDISVQVGNDTVPFAGLPANGVVANFPDKGMFIATDKSAVVREVESLRDASKQILEQVPMQEKMLKEYEAILLELQPERRKEALQTAEIENLKSQISTMNSKFDSLMNFLSDKLRDGKSMED